MLAKLLTPRWLVVHALAVLWVAVCLWLGWWQWERARSAGGSFQNLGYALQWPLFALFGVYMWIRSVHMEFRGEAEDRTGQEERRTPEPIKPTRYRRRSPAVPAEPESADPELVEYNRYLRELAAREQAARTGS